MESGVENTTAQEERRTTMEHSPSQFGPQHPELQSSDGIYVKSILAAVEVYHHAIGVGGKSTAAIRRTTTRQGHRG